VSVLVGITLGLDVGIRVGVFVGFDVGVAFFKASLTRSSCTSLTFVTPLSQRVIVRSLTPASAAKSTCDMPFAFGFDE